MKFRLLGQTGLYVSELCLGTMTYGSVGFWEIMGGLDQAAVSAQVKYAFDRGINFIDFFSELMRRLKRGMKKMGLNFSATFKFQ